MQEISAVLHCLVLNPDARLIQINLGYPLSPLHDERHRSRQIRRPAAQSKLRSSAQGLLRLLCASYAQIMQINRDFTLSPHNVEGSMSQGGQKTKQDGRKPVILFCAREQSRTATPVTALPPESSASTNFATRASEWTANIRNVF